MSLWDALINMFRGPAATAALDPMLAGQRYAAIADTNDDMAPLAKLFIELGLSAEQFEKGLERAIENVRRAAESLRDACAELEAKVTVK